mmetsp:Transcript_6747/g.10192  ORF Transcript_6747/g.10192 Transcript_6747/m.10192 type:complete len:91 (-) Transcript_6747:87-359(-)
MHIYIYSKNKHLLYLTDSYYFNEKIFCFMFQKLTVTECVTLWGYLFSGGGGRDLKCLCEKLISPSLSHTHIYVCPPLYISIQQYGILPLS